MDERRTIEFKFRHSRALDTHGYPMCTMRVGGKVVSRETGFVNLQAILLGNWVAQTFPKRLASLSGEKPIALGFYGETDGRRVFSKTASPETPSPIIDGGYGWDAVREICEAIGLRLRFVIEGRSEAIYTIEWEGDD